APPPRERPRRPPRGGNRPGDPEGAGGERVRGRRGRDGGGGPRWPGEGPPPGGAPPRPPLEPLHGGARVEAQRVERALEPEEDVRRASQRRGPLDLSPGVGGRVRCTAREPPDERVEHVEAVSVEIERQLPPRPASPPQGSRPRGGEASLRAAQRVHVQPPVGEPHGYGTRVQAGAGEQRWLEDRLDR